MAVTEWGVRRRDNGDLWHRGLSEQDARSFLAKWIAEGGEPDALQVVRRQVSPWQVSA